MISAERKLIVSAAWTLTVLGVWSIAQRVAQAEEAQPPRQVRVELKVTGPAIPGLARIPYIGRLFAKAEEECCEKEGEIAETFERIGIDFDNQACPHAKGAPCEKCAFDLCPACPANSQCEAIAKGACKACANAACSASSACCKQNECVIQTVSNEEKCAVDEPCQKTACVVSSRLADLVAENMSLNTALESKEQMLQIQTEMMERFATMMAEKVQLQCQLEFSQQLHAEREKSRQKIDELAQENTRLKNLVEIAAVRHEVEQSKVDLAQENHRLKERVAELELARREAKTDVRVAKKPRATRTEK